MKTQMTGKTKQRLFLVLALLIALLSAVNFFYNISEYPLQNMDEARHGVNAYEMVKTGELTATTYGYEYDYWNVKPPLSSWMIAAGYRIFGFGTLGLRFYSALSGVALTVAVMLAARRFYGRQVSLCSGVIFAAVPRLSFINGFSLRFGDPNGLFYLLYFLCIFCLMLSVKRTKFFPLAVLAASLALLDKGAHALTAFAALFFVWLFFRLFQRMRAADYLLSAAALLPVGVWAVFRYLEDGAEFFTRMVTIDLFNRVTTVVENHTGGGLGPLFYLKTILDDNKILFAGLFVLLLLSVIILLAVKRKKVFSALKAGLEPRRETWVLWLGLLIPLLLFSVSQSKIDRYIYPVYSVLAILAARWLVAIFRALRENRVALAAAAMVCVAMFLGNEGFILSQYRGEIYIPEYETAVKQVSAEYETSGRLLYCTYKRVDDPDIEVPRAFSGWTQSVLFAGELYADFIPTEGGEEAFLASAPGSYLMAPVEDLSGSSVLKENAGEYRVCFTGEYLVILQKV